MAAKGKGLRLDTPRSAPARSVSLVARDFRDRRRVAGRQRGFTLVELVSVIIIVGVLAVMALPRYIALGTDARVAAVRTLASTLRSTAENVRVLCKLNANCDYNANQTLTIAGQTADLNYGWLDAGDSTAGEIDDWINVSGFTKLLYGGHELYTLDGSPNPTNCSVDYLDAYYRGPVAGILIVTNTSGC